MFSFNYFDLRKILFLRFKKIKCWRGFDHIKGIYSCDSGKKKGLAKTTKQKRLSRKAALICRSNKLTRDLIYHFAKSTIHLLPKLSNLLVH